MGQNHIKSVRNCEKPSEDACSDAMLGAPSQEILGSPRKLPRIPGGDAWQTKDEAEAFDSDNQDRELFASDQGGPCTEGANEVLGSLCLKYLKRAIQEMENGDEEDVVFIVVFDPSFASLFSSYLFHLSFHPSFHPMNS